ncbi:MAG: hypothetical protein RLO21_15765 [Nitratireductor sp.]
MDARVISFGDTVRIRTTSITQKTGHAELVGQVFGETTPSSTGIDVIGELAGDYAINVYFEDKSTDAWFDPALLEFVDHGAGTELRLDGVDKKWVRSEDGTWDEHPDNAPPGNNRPWWKIW